MAVPAPALLYGDALRRRADLVARAADGTARTVPVRTWLAPAAPADERVLARAGGPVLDVGCGPGRHVHLLARRGVLALGVDVSATAAGLARRRGVAVLEASIFDRIPGAGSWRCALLLDGNIGIGGDPAALLLRLAGLLAPGGTVLVELEAPGAPSEATRLRLEDGPAVSGWFDWAHVAADRIAAPATAAGLAVLETWEDDGRWFAALGTAT